MDMYNDQLYENHNNLKVQKLTLVVLKHKYPVRLSLQFYKS